MTNRIKKIVSRKERCYPAGCDLTDRGGNVITDHNTTNYDDIGSDYDPANDSSGTSDPPTDTPDNRSTDNDSISNLDDDDSATILNPYGVDHNLPISGVETNHNNLHGN